MTPSLHARAIADQDFDAALRKAIENKRAFPPLPAPVLPGGRVAAGSRGAGALAPPRTWGHRARPTLSLWPRSEGLIGAIDAFVLDEACRQLAQWMSEGACPADFTVSVNVSGQQLSDPALVERVASAIKRHGIVPSQLCLEVTETALIGELGEAATTLARLSELGVLLALDDFGTGYSTLAHVQRLNVDILKIDRSFVEQMTGNERDREIIGAINGHGPCPRHVRRRRGHRDRPPT